MWLGGLFFLRLSSPCIIAFLSLCEASFLQMCNYQLLVVCQLFAIYAKQNVKITFFCIKILFFGNIIFSKDFFIYLRKKTILTLTFVLVLFLTIKRTWFLLSFYAQNKIFKGTKDGDIALENIFFWFSNKKGA